MLQVMTGQGSDPTSGVEGLLTRGQEGHRGTVPPLGGTTVLDLLAVPVETVIHERSDRLPTVVPSADVEVVLDPSWLLDLHDPTLVISPGYVGPDRRGTDRTWDSPEPAPGRWTPLLRRAVQVVVATVVVAVPLVLMASPAVPPSARPTPPSVTKVAPTPTTARDHHAARAAGSATARTAQIEVAHQRALARASARIAAAASVATAQAVKTLAATTGDVRTADRAEAHARATQDRAAARAEAVRRRADRAAARAATRRAAPRAWHLAFRRLTAPTRDRTLPAPGPEHPDHFSYGGELPIPRHGLRYDTRTDSGGRQHRRCSPRSVPRLA